MKGSRTGCAFLLFFVLQLLWVGPSWGFSDGNVPPTFREKRLIRLAQDFARECARTIEKMIRDGLLSEEEVFSTLYFPIEPLRSPPTFHTFYDRFFDKLIRPIEDRYLQADKHLVYAVLVDRNGYLPSHNTIYSQKLTGKRLHDIKWNRTKRIFNDITGFRAARNLKPYLIQLYKRDTGEIMIDLSVPVFVNGKHWGAVRLGYFDHSPQEGKK